MKRIDQDVPLPRNDHGRDVKQQRSLGRHPVAPELLALERGGDRVPSLWRLLDDLTSPIHVGRNLYGNQISVEYHARCAKVNDRLQDGQRDRRCRIHHRHADVVPAAPDYLGGRAGQITFIPVRTSAG